MTMLSSLEVVVLVAVSTMSGSGILTCGTSALSSVFTISFSAFSSTNDVSTAIDVSGNPSWASATSTPSAVKRITSLPEAEGLVPGFGAALIMKSLAVSVS